MTDIPKNSRKIIRITRADFKGHDTINVRIFFGAGEVEMKPGKQWVAFCAALLPYSLRALGALVTEVAV